MEERDWSKEIEVVDDSEFHKNEEAEYKYQKMVLFKWLKNTFFNSYWQILKYIILMILFYISAQMGLLTLYIISTGIFFIFTNFEKRKRGTLSAYPLMNKNFQR